jgi:fatty aldehyde-generating acyl-ACP reductase
MPRMGFNRADFALITHFETWDRAAAAISLLRGLERPPISLEDIRDILPWIPPRPSSRVTVGSSQGHQVHGVCIDSFIPPDRLDRRFLRENLARVREAAQAAIREGVRIVTLGGFSSILLEGKTDLLPSHPETAFTTGNTLTVALIVRGVERALELAGRDLRESNVLIVGASGDVGSGCARCLAPRVSQLFLCARNADRLTKLASEFLALGSQVMADTEVTRLSQNADVVICAASLPASDLHLTLPRGTIVCDAGYPKNLSPEFAPCDGLIFYGGLGQACGGIRLDPDLLPIVYPYPLSNLTHGCLLEGIVLAMEKRFEPFSQGRGNITPQRVDEIWTIAQKHGIGLPPLFNGAGLVEFNAAGRLASASRSASLRAPR